MSAALLVLGMHRSGTSALTRVLNLLGAALPRNLIPAVKESNELGHWESIDLMAIHDEMLASVGSSWHDVTAFPDAWAHSAAAEPFRNRILEVLTRDHSGDSMFVIKDPRVCRFVPFWLDLVDRFGATPHPIVPVRNPLEVARSLERRDGFPIVKGAMLWLRHILDAEHATRERPRSIVTYDALLDDWAAAVETIRRDLGLDWPSAPHQAAPEIEAFLSTSHRHHRCDRETLRTHPQIPGWVSQAYEALIALGRRDDDQAARDRLDAIRAELCIAEHAFGPLLADLQRHQERSEDRLRAAEHQNAALQADLAAASQQLATLETTQETIRAASDQQAALLRRLIYETQQQIRRDLVILDRIEAVERRGIVIETRSDQVLAALRTPEAESRSLSSPSPSPRHPGRRWWRHLPGASRVPDRLKPPIRRMLLAIRRGSATEPDRTP